MTIRLGEVCTTNRKCRRVPHSLNARLHWAERHRWNNAWKEEVYYRIRGTYPQTSPSEYAIITITIHSIRPQDYDNAVACLKPVIDGMKGLVIVDDDPAHCEIRVDTKKVNKKVEEGIEIKTWETTK